MDQKELIPLLEVNEAKQKKLTGVIAEGVNLLIACDTDEVLVYQGSCPHQGTLLAEGTIENGLIVCPAHHWKFECASGKKQGNGNACLKKFDVVIRDGKIFVPKEQLQAWKASGRSKGKVKGKVANRKFKDLPGPASWPVVGNLPAILSDMKHLHKTLHRWALKYGPLYKLHGFMHNRSLVVSDPAIAREILMDRPHTFSRIKTMGSAMEEVGLNGLITAEGDLWKKYRKFSTHGLANKLLREYYLTIERSTHRLVQLLKTAAEEQQPMEIQRDLLRYTVDVTSSLAFGVDINTLENSDDELQAHLAIVLPMVQRRMMIPVPYWRYVKLSVDRKLDKSLNAIKGTIEGFIHEARQRVKDRPELATAPSNYLEALLAARDEEGNSLSDDEIYSNVFSILLAGEDSTANSIAWVLHYMMENPGIQQKMQEEIDRVLGDHHGLATFEQLQQLPYIEAVVHETLRLRPVLPVVQLCANEDIVISDIEIPKGTNIQLPIYNIFSNDEYFKNSKEFNPERWLSPDSETQHIMQHAFLPFGYGPRVCPGRSLALLENKTVLSMICRYFTVSKPKDGLPVEEIFSGLIQPVNLVARFTKRERSVKKEAMAAHHGEIKSGKCPMGFSREDGKCDCKNKPK